MEEHSATHPDFGELEAHRCGEADAATASHVAGCPECQSNLQELEALAGMVRGGESPLPSVPDEVEERILWNARRNAARVRRQRVRSSLQRWAIAASLLLSAGALVVWRTAKQDSGPSLALPRERDAVKVSQLDIVDALTLARQLAAARPADRRYDVNHDGRVDGADVERIARQAVALGGA